MKVLLLLAAFSAAPAHAAEATASPSTDLALSIVQLDPPSGSTLKVGQVIEATIAWRYSRPAIRVPIWFKLDLPDSDPDYQYEADTDARQPGQGRLVRRVTLSRPGHVESVVLMAKDASSREIYRVRVPVNYTFVGDTAFDALRKDGLGSRITGVTLDPPSPARLAPGARVGVRIAYDARSEHGLQPTARPITDCAMTWNGGFDPVSGSRSLDQSFAVGVPCVVRKISVRLSNQTGAIVDEKVIDVDLRYER